MTPLRANEVFLLETFSSPEHLAKLRDIWGRMIAHVESCLATHMRNLPLGYRALPLPEQADAVWGERILPNFRDTFLGLCSGHTSVTQGDYLGLRAAHGPMNDFRGQCDFSHAWMSEGDANTYFQLLNSAATIASDIRATVERFWEPHSLAQTESKRTAMEPPAHLPNYRLRADITVKTDEEVSEAGIYLPNVDHSSPQFLCPPYEAPQAIIVVGSKDLINPTDNSKYGEEPEYDEVDCIWTLVERDTITRN